MASPLVLTVSGGIRVEASLTNFLVAANQIIPKFCVFLNKPLRHEALISAKASCQLTWAEDPGPWQRGGPNVALALSSPLMFTLAVQP